MRKSLVLAGAFMVLALPLLAQYSGSCQNAKIGCYAAGSLTMFGPLDEKGCIAESKDVWMEAPCPEPTPPPAEDGGLWGLIKAWADKFTIWKGDAASVAHILAVLATFLAAIQAVKKVLENLAKWAWLLKLVPQLAVVFNFLAHGIGPMILNALITGGTLVTVAVQDGALTLGEVFAIVGAVVGTDVLYRALRKWIFPKAP